MKTKYTTYVSAMLAAFAFASPSVQADVLAQWSFASNLAPTAQATNMSASDVSYGSFSGLSEGTFTYGRSSGGQDLYSRAFDNSVTPVRILGTNETVSVDTRQTYFEFTLTPSGDTFDFTSFSATIKAQIASDPDTGFVGFTAYYFLRSDVDGYSSNLGTGSVSVSSVTAGQGATSEAVTLEADLSSFQNISSSVTFRLYTYAVGDGGVSLTNNHIVRTDTFTVNGTSIPESGNTAALLGGVLVALLLIRRRARS